MESIGLAKHEDQLTRYAIKRLRELPYIRLYTDLRDDQPQIGAIPFLMDGISDIRLAELLADQAGIAVRNGCFCAHPYVQSLLGVSEEEIGYYYRNPQEERPGLVRISFGIYNNCTEIDKLIEALQNIATQR